MVRNWIICGSCRSPWSGVIWISFQVTVYKYLFGTSGDRRALECTRRGGHQHQISRLLGGQREGVLFLGEAWSVSV